MSSTIKNNKLKNGNEQRSNSSLTKAPTATSATLKKAHGNITIQEKKEQKEQRREGQPR
jgi:hypothetical protein